MKTQDINKVPMKKGFSGRDFFTKYNFYFKDGGSKYYIDSISGGLTDMTIRNSTNGNSRIILIKTDLQNGRYSKSFFFCDK